MAFVGLIGFSVLAGVVLIGCGGTGVSDGSRVGDSSSGGTSSDSGTSEGSGIVTDAQALTAASLLLCAHTEVTRDIEVESDPTTSDSVVSSEIDSLTVESPHGGSVEISGEATRYLTNAYEFDETRTDTKRLDIVWDGFCYESSDVVVSGTSQYREEDNMRTTGPLWWDYQVTIEGNAELSVAGDGGFSDSLSFTVTNTGGTVQAVAEIENTNRSRKRRGC